MTALSSVFIEVRPDTSGFSADLKRSLAKTREAVDVAARLDTSKIKPQLDALKADLKAITVTKANITAESAQMTARIRTLKAQLKELDTKAKIDGDPTGFNNAARIIKAEIASLQNQKVKISVDASQANAHLKALNAQLNVFSRDAEDANGSGSGLGGTLGRLASGFAGAGASISKILTISGAVGPALVAVGSAASAASAGAVSLVGALGPAAAAGGAVYAGVMGTIAQGAGVAKFAFGGLAEAISGDKDAMKALTPEGRELARSLKALTPEVKSIRQEAQRGLFPGVEEATTRLARNYFPLLKVAARQTGASLGDLAVRASLLTSSGPWKRDFATVTSTNAQNLRVLGTIGLSLADVFRNLYVTSLPLTTAFLQWGAGAARALQGLTQAGRDSGRLAAFWERAGVAGAQLGRIVGNLSVALFRVFKIGSDPTGRGLLASIETMTARFREWTGSASGAASIAKWFAQGRTNLQAMGRLVGAVFGSMRTIGSGQQLAPLIDQIRLRILPPLTEFLHNASASGALGALVEAVGRVIGVFARLAATDGSLKAFAKTLGALATGAGWIIDNVPGASRALGIFFTVAGTASALKLVGIGNGLSSLVTGFNLVATAAGRATIAEKTNAIWTGVMSAAQKAAAITTGLWTGAVNLLNLAWRANPIGVVITGLTLLGAALFLAYKKSETFRNIVNGAFDAVKKVASRVVQSFMTDFVPLFTRTLPNAFHATVDWTKRNWPVILAILTGPIGLATLFITRHWTTIRTAFANARDWVVSNFKRGWDRVQSILSTPVSNARDAIVKIWGKIRDAFANARDWVTSNFKRGWDRLKDILSNPVDAGRDLVLTILGKIRDAFGNIRDWALSNFKRSWANLKAVILNPIEAARDAIRNLLGSGGPFRNAFSNAVDAIKRIWGKLEGATKGPVRFVVNTVLNNGLFKAIGKLPFIDAPHFTLPRGFARGGEVPMWAGTPGQDSVPAMLMPGEHVWTTKEVQKAGGHAAVERIRQEVKGEASAHRFAKGGRVQHFLQGGAVGGGGGNRPVLMDGKQISLIAARQIRLAEKLSGINMRIMQGGYGGSHIAASGTSHNYPGVADISPGSIAAEKILRRVGFAAWARNIRGRSSVGSGAHVHAVSLLDPGDRRSPQVYGSWAGHGNGLGGRNNDPAPHYPWIANLRSLLGNIPLASLGGGGGGGGGLGYTGISKSDYAAQVKPTGWVNHLRAMGGYGATMAKMVSGLAGQAKDWGFGKITSAIKAAGAVFARGGAGPGSARAVKEYAPIVRQVLIDLGQGATGGLVGKVLRRMNQESGGNPRAVNHTDSNARAGYPSTGLMQVIRGTYNAYKPHPDFGPYLNGVSINPYSNIYAGLNYARHRYPSIAYAMDKSGGYDGGGIARGKGLLPKNIIAPERVLDPRTTRNFERLTQVLDRNDNAAPRTLRVADGRVEFNPRTMELWIRDLAVDEITDDRRFQKGLN